MMTTIAVIGFLCWVYFLYSVTTPVLETELDKWDKYILLFACYAVTLDMFIMMLRQLNG